MQTLRALVASGFGIALIPASLASNMHEDMVCRTITVDAPDELLYAELFVGWNEAQILPVRDRLMEKSG